MSVLDPDIIFRAQVTVVANPEPEDAVSNVAACCELGSHELATFDEALGSVETITRWRPR